MATIASVRIVSCAISYPAAFLMYVFACNQRMVKWWLISSMNCSVCVSICRTWRRSRSLQRVSMYSWRNIFTTRPSFLYSERRCSAQYANTFSAYTHATLEIINGTNAIIMFSSHVNVSNIRSVLSATNFLNWRSVIGNGRLFHIAGVRIASPMFGAMLLSQMVFNIRSSDALISSGVGE